MNNSPYLDFCISNGLNVLFIGEHGVGKAQPLFSKIKTINGWSTMGELKVGDFIASPDGKPSMVTNIYPQGLKEVYRIIFKDGRSTMCCKEHLWKVLFYKGSTKSFKENYQWRVINTEEIMNRKSSNKNSHLRIPLIQPNNYSIDLDLPLDPYVLGCIIGDGGISGDGIRFSSKDAFIIKEVNKLLPSDYILKKCGKYDYNLRRKILNPRVKNDIVQILLNLELQGHKSSKKFIPSIYKLSSNAQKIRLLQGLIDTDGYVGKGGCIQYYTSSECLANDVVDLVRSIGGIAVCRVRCSSYKHNGIKINCLPSYRISIRYYNPSSLVRLPRKLNRCPKNYQYSNLTLEIDRVEKINQIEECKCISVSHPDQLYITDDYIVTHNTAVIKEVFSKHFGDNWKYFSGSTLDPWVDFVGTPKERIGDDGIPYLDLVRPQVFAKDEVEAIFMDEYNRCLTGDTLIQHPDGHSTPIKDLIGKESFYVYSYDTDQQKVSIGKGHSARMTVKNASLVKITLDNGTTVRCTKDHPFLLSTNHYIPAENLKPGDSLMCLYKKHNMSIGNYEMVSSYRPSKWMFTYHLADEYNLKNGVYLMGDNEQRHHKDFDRHNNSPDNIQRLSLKEHIRLHSSDGGTAAHIKHPDLVSRTLQNTESRLKAYQNSALTRSTDVEYKRLRSALSRKYFSDPLARKNKSEKTKQQWKDGKFDKINRQQARTKAMVGRTIRKIQENLPFNQNLTLELYETIRNRFRGLGYGRGILQPKTIERYFGSFDNFVNHYYSTINKVPNKNHRIVSVELDGVEDVYDITVDEYHNFALGCGAFVHNSPVKVRNAIMELIQFKSINGKKFNNLKVIWAAINPEKKQDNDIEYDVEKIDPAQKDRFHVHIEIPYKLNLDYFTSKYGEEQTGAASEWWNDLSKELKYVCSPRRLDYALEIYNKGEKNLRFIIPPECNLTKFYRLLEKGNIEKQIIQLKSPDDIKEFFKDFNNVEDALPVFYRNIDVLKHCFPYIPEEFQSKLLCSDKADLLADAIKENPLKYLEIANKVKLTPAKYKKFMDLVISNSNTDEITKGYTYKNIAQKGNPTSPVTATFDNWAQMLTFHGTEMKKANSFAIKENFLCQAVELLHSQHPVCSVPNINQCTALMKFVQILIKRTHKPETLNPKLTKVICSIQSVCKQVNGKFVSLSWCDSSMKDFMLQHANEFI